MTKLRKLKIALKESIKINDLNKMYTISDHIIELIGFEDYLLILNNIERE